MEFKWRKSKSKEDTLLMAEKLSETYDISPYTVAELSEVISAGIRAGAIRKEKRGQSYVVDLEKWFTERLMPNTITLSQDDYKKAEAIVKEMLEIVKKSCKSTNTQFEFIRAETK